MSRWSVPRWQVVRDGLLFFLGSGLAVNELALSKAPTTLEELVLIAGMLGLPIFLRGDQQPPGPTGVPSPPSPPQPAPTPSPDPALDGQGAPPPAAP